MRTIWKYELEITDEQFIDMPEFSEILCVQIQNERLCIWVLVDANSPKVKRRFFVFGTGNPIEFTPNEIRRYIGTVQQHWLVWHVFEGVG